VRGALIDLWKRPGRSTKIRSRPGKSLVENPESRQRWQKARGKGGLRRADWDTMLELIAAANIYTIKKYGPTASRGSHPSGDVDDQPRQRRAHAFKLMGGVSCRSMLVRRLAVGLAGNLGLSRLMCRNRPTGTTQAACGHGSNLNIDSPRPNCHFAAEARHNGSKCGSSRRTFHRFRSTRRVVAINAGQMAPGGWR